MKKIALTLALLITLSVCTFNVPVLAEDQMFVAKFTAVDSVTGSLLNVFQTSEGTPCAEIGIPFDEGYVIKAEDVPEFHLEAWKNLVFQNWDTNPVGFEMTADVIFVATFSGNTLSSVRFCALDRFDGSDISAFGSSSEITFSFQTGHVLTEEDLPGFHFDPGTNLFFDGWEPNPVGATVTDGLTFTAYFVPGYVVCFINEVAHLYTREQIKHGSDAIPPEIPEVEGYILVGWDKPYTNITEDVNIYAKYWQYGDVNMDSALNTGDAGMLLNYAAKLSTLDEMQMRLGDYNKDGAVNVGDAAAILAFIVGVN